MQQNVLVIVLYAWLREEVKKKVLLRGMAGDAGQHGVNRT